MQNKAKLICWTFDQISFLVYRLRTFSRETPTFVGGLVPSKVGCGALWQRHFVPRIATWNKSFLDDVDHPFTSILQGKIVYPSQDDTDKQSYQREYKTLYSSIVNNFTMGIRWAPREIFINRFTATYHLMGRAAVAHTVTGTNRSWNQFMKEYGKYVIFNQI